MSRTAWILAVASAILALGQPAQALPPLGVNLILNPLAEADVGPFDGFVVVPVTGWSTVGNATLASYGAAGGFPTSTDPGPPDRASNFFAGGIDNASSALHQSIDVTGGGGAPFALDGWFGGYDGHGDNATLTATFVDAANVALGTAAIGPVLLADRPFGTGFLPRSTTGVLPLGTVRVDFSLDFVRLDGNYNDGYADSLSFQLTGPPVPEPSTCALAIAAAAILVAARTRRGRHGEA